MKKIKKELVKKVEKSFHLWCVCGNRDQGEKGGELEEPTDGQPGLVVLKARLL